MNTQPNRIFWHNGNLIAGKTLELAIDEPGLLYGATVFTTLRVYNGNLDDPQTNWPGHLRRLYSSLQSFDWQLPDWERVRQGAEILRDCYPVLRITLFPDGREWITGRNLPADLTERQKNGIAAWVAEGREWGRYAIRHAARSLPTYKTGNYLSPWLALQQAQKYGAKEAILVDESGNWLETSTGNLWGWQDGKWWTPPVAAGILPGLMREQLIKQLHSKNEKVGEEPWTPEFVRGLEAIAYSNSVVEVVPIHTISTVGAGFTGNLAHKLNPPHPAHLPPNHPAFQKLRP